MKTPSEYNIGVIRRLDNTGLGYQSRALARMLNAKTLDVNDGGDIPSFERFADFLSEIDVLFTAETPYTYDAWNWARMVNVRTFCQPNWEFFDGLVQPNMPHPDQYLIPSYWHLEDFQEMFPNAVYLPPPTIEDDFKAAKKANEKRSKRFVHIVGANAIYDRNGWALLREALEHTIKDFELVVYSQQEITGLIDPRVKYHIFNIEDQADLYTGFDALILPRRYGGLCLPMNEALLSSLPVIMTDIVPNNSVLPVEWLVPAFVSASFEGRSVIDVYGVEPKELARKIDWLCDLSDARLYQEKLKAYTIGHRNYSDKVLKQKYKDICNLKI